MNLIVAAAAPLPASHPALNPLRPIAQPLVRPQVAPKVSPKIQQAARQFETQLLTSLLGSLETSLGSVPGSEQTGASQQYHTMAVQGLAGAWAAAGGIGIARILTRALTQAPKGMPLPGLPGPLPVAALPPAVALSLDSRPATSSFSRKGR